VRLPRYADDLWGSGLGFDWPAPVGRVSDSEHLLPWRPVRALRARLHLITNAVFETRQQVLDSREMLLARLDSIAGKVDDLATARGSDSAP
jgi:hypothetical protein